MVGIDVASTDVDVAAIGAELPAALGRVNNDADGHSALAEGLARLRPELVLMEATGGYEAALACALQAVGLRVAVVSGLAAGDRVVSAGQVKLRNGMPVTLDDKPAPGERAATP